MTLFDSLSSMSFLLQYKYRIYFKLYFTKISNKAYYTE